MSPTPACRRHQGGFTLMEMAVVLVIIALILGGVSVGRDVYRSAQAERIGSEFLQGWVLAYERYTQQTASVPGDNPGAPTGRINAVANKPLCDQALHDALLSAGITLPAGRAEGLNSRALYQDANGSPQEVQVCLLSIDDWAEPAVGRTTVLRKRNVMRLSGLTPELARQLDARLDGRLDARHGSLRELGQHNLAGNVAIGADHPWSLDELDGNRRTHGTAAVPTLIAYLRLSQ